MDRAALGIHGSSHASAEVRVEIVLGEDHEPRRLHDRTGGGRYSEVFAGFWGGGQMPMPVAIKLERDNLEGGTARLKFINEYQVQVKVQHDLPSRGDHSRIVKLFGAGNLTADLACDQLEPTILCTSSRTVLAPCCPSGCGENLRPDLSCPVGCARGTTPDTNLILAATCCPYCASQRTPCKSLWLNRRTCKILLLEMLDLDLEDYIRWRWLPMKTAPEHRSAWTKFQAHTEALANRENRLGLASDPIATEFDELRFILGLYADLVAAVQHLHRCGITHLDLKPPNLCLTLDGPLARLKVIDLGAADSHGVAWGIRYSSLIDDANQDFPVGLFGAPEQERTRFQSIVVEAEPIQGGHRLLVREPIDIVVGDYFCFPMSDDDGEEIVEPIDRIERTGAEIVLTTRATSSQKASHKHRGRVNDGQLLRQANYAADLFAMGMLLIHLLVRGQVDLQPLRLNHAGLTRYLREKLSSTAPLPARVAVDELVRCPNGELAAVWKRVLAALPEQPQLHELHRELLGVGLQALVRGIVGFSHAEHRGDGPECVDRLQADLGLIRRRANILVQTHDLHSGRVACSRRTGLKRLRVWLETQPIRQTRNEQPPYDRERISHVLDLLSSQKANNEKEFRFLMRTYHEIGSWLERDLVLFEQELDAGLTAARQVHPVVQAMFELVSPVQIKKKEILGDLVNGRVPDPLQLGRAFRGVQQGRDQGGELVRKLTEFLRQFQNKSRRSYFEKSEIQIILGTPGGMETLTRDLMTNANHLDTWFRQQQKAKKRTIEGWDRLDLCGSGEWVQFGSRVLNQFVQEEEQADAWLARVGFACESIRDVVSWLVEEFTPAWQQSSTWYPWSPRGFFSWLTALFTRRPFVFRLVLSENGIDRIARGVRIATEALGEIWPVPFDLRLAATVASGRSDSE